MKLKLLAIALVGAAIGFANPAVISSSAHAQSNMSAYAEAAGGNGSFSSDYFNMKISLPPSWVMASEKEAREILNVGSEMVAGEDSEMKDRMDSSVAKSLPIMFASKYAMSAGRSDNINVSAIAENVAAIPMYITGEAYFSNMKLIASQSATPITFEDGYTETLIGGQPFTTMQATISIDNVQILQEYYAARRGDHIVSIISTYLSEDDKFLLDGIISNIEFGADS